MNNAQESAHNNVKAELTCGAACQGIRQEIERRRRWWSWRRRWCIALDRNDELDHEIDDDADDNDQDD